MLSNKDTQVFNLGLLLYYSDICFLVILCNNYYYYHVISLLEVNGQHICIFFKTFQCSSLITYCLGSFEEKNIMAKLHDKGLSFNKNKSWYYSFSICLALQNF